MVEFTNFVAKKWNIPEKIAGKTVERFEKGDTFYYLSDYDPVISAEIDSSTLSNIFDCLTEIKKLDTKKKRVLNALKKAQALTDAVERRIKLCTVSTELDDMLMPFRSIPRSKAQMALNKGLGPLVNLIYNQETEQGTIEELAREYVGKDPGLSTVGDVIAGVKDVLLDRYSSDETTRSMVREIGFEDGFFEVLPKVKKDKRFAAYRGKLIPVHELTSEEFLNLMDLERKKEIRFKHGVQLFHISELLRHHFITNPDSIGFDLICEVIDECWITNLQPTVEAAVKTRLTNNAEEWALRRIEEELFKKEQQAQPGFSSILVVGKYNPKSLVIGALNGQGNLIGATEEQFQITPGKETKEVFSNKIRQFCERYKPQRIIISNNQYADVADVIVKRSIGKAAEEIPVEKYTCDDNTGLIQSAWMQERGKMLDDSMKDIYALGLKYIQPMSIIPQIGANYFTIHPLQKYIGTDRLGRLLIRKVTERELHKGIPCLEIIDSVLRNLECVTDEILINIRKEGVKKPFDTKNDLLRVEGMTEIIFRNIAGYIIIPQANSVLDRTLVHPDHYRWIETISQELDASFETLVQDPDCIRAVSNDNFAEKMFLDQKLTEQLRMGQQYITSFKTSGRRKKLNLAELKEGAVVKGRVTNITKFGVFVDINAVCDGLIHISQLADDYIETPDQVVKLDDEVDVRIMKVDKKKRRISLSMKKLGDKAPKIRPSHGQLTNLADHFKNR